MEDILSPADKSKLICYIRLCDPQKAHDILLENGYVLTFCDQGKYYARITNEYWNRTYYNRGDYARQDSKDNFSATLINDEVDKLFSSYEIALFGYKKLSWQK